MRFERIASADIPPSRPNLSPIILAQRPDRRRDPVSHQPFGPITRSNFAMSLAPETETVTEFDCVHRTTALPHAGQRCGSRADDWVRQLRTVVSGTPVRLAISQLLVPDAMR